METLVGVAVIDVFESVDFACEEVFESVAARFDAKPILSASDD